MSSILHEVGFDPENIRVMLAQRAMRAAIRERIDRLRDGTADEEERFLYQKRSRRATARHHVFDD